ncbi:MAG: pyridoxal phosphate-dependent aminotransferase [candidate division Zixibacteria bacterium]|nr:pyridoxal phosphate-dependent aminotransferase [candidate division Zixibacteria bacterium]
MIKKVILDKADRLYHFPFDLEDYYPKRIITSVERRIPIIDLGHFNWPIRKIAIESAENPLKAADQDELFRLKSALSEWLKTEYSLDIDPRKEIYIGEGIRRIIFDLCMAFVEYGDVVLCPEPGLPFYRRHTIAAGGIPVLYPISERTGFKPSLKRLPENLGRTAKLLFLNNPHNPLGTVLDETDLGELIRNASKINLFLIHDSAYCSLTEEKHISPLSLPAGRKVALEIFSIPFTFGLPHLPFGFAIGSSEIIGGLETASKTTGSFIPSFWVNCALKAIQSYPSAELRDIRKNIGHSRQTAKEMVENFGWKIAGSNSSPFLWLKIPERRHSAIFANTLLRRKGILTLPGDIFACH